NPGQQVYEPAHPDRQGIFTTLEPGSSGPEGRVKPLWKLGYRSLRWKVEDPNQDDLTYSLSFQPLEGPGSGQWLKVAEDLTEDYYSFDATVLPDGMYRFRLVASDRRSNADEEALTAEQLTGPVVVDHSVPRLESVRRQASTLEARVSDALNPLREAVVSIDAGEWKPAVAADGLVDGRREVLRVAVPAGARMVLLRLTDGAHNVVTLDLMKELE
ncbi:MAG: hypothetical protein KDD47_00470, partial [Acidobacteria bacterium]|nr:hypothetical protein [Acidobacteriota bacterium]